MNSRFIEMCLEHNTAYIGKSGLVYRMKPSWVLALVAVGLMMSVPTVFAASGPWTGPTICGSSAPSTANCGNVPEGSTVSIVLSQTTVTTAPTIFAGWCPSTSTYNGFYVTTLRVTNLNTGAKYLLETGTASKHKALSNTNPLVVAAGTTVVVPFANNPVPTMIAGQGPFSWASTKGVFNPTGLTSTSGNYQVDEQGYTLCGTTAVNVEFTAQWYVDQKASFSVPEFGLGPMLVVALGMVGLVLVRKRLVVPPPAV